MAPAHAFRAPLPIGVGARRQALAARVRRVLVRLAPPSGAGQPPRPPAAAGADSSHDVARRLAAPHPAGGRARAVVVAGLTAFVVTTYGVVVLGGGALLGRTSSPDLCSRSRDRRGGRRVRPGRTLLDGPPLASSTAGDPAVRRLGAVLRDGRRHLSGEELPSRMARVLAEATAARATEVWLTVQGHPTLAATWPHGPSQHARATQGAGAPGPARSGRRSACSSCQERAADRRRGTAVRGAGRPGRTGAAQCAAPRRAGAPRRRAIAARRGASASRRGWSTSRTTKKGAGAGHPRRGPAAPRRARGEPPAGADGRDPLAGAVTLLAP